ncbi:helix-turn-helix domain-containing protein [Pseudoroseomonas wenyumeiae]
MNDSPARGPDFVAALERGLAVLETFGRGRERLTLTEVAAHTISAAAPRGASC